MLFPWAMGATPTGGDSAPEAYRKVMRRLQGEGGYTTAEGSVREAELFAAGVASGVGGIAIQRAWANSLPHLAEERLDDWEAALDVPNDAARTDAQRRERLAITVGHGGEAGIESIEAGMAAVAPSAVVQTNSAAICDADAAEPKTRLYAAVALDDVDYDAPLAHRGVKALLPRMLPVRNRGRDFDGDLEKMIVTGYEARLASAASFFDRDALAQQTAVTRSMPTSPARLVTYAPLVKLLASDLNAIQDAALMDRVRGSGDGMSSFTASLIGQARRVFSCSIGAGATAQIDTSVDWRDRMIFSTLQQSASDIRPGQASDGISVATTSTFWYSGTGGTGSYSRTDGLRWQVNSSTGALELFNGAGSTTFARGMVFATEDLGKR